MALFMLHDRLWVGSNDSAIKQNLEGHGLKVVVILEEARVPADVDALAIERIPFPIGPGKPPAFPALRELLDTLLDRISKGKRVLIIDKTGEGSSGAIAALYLTLFAYAWDEAWSVVLKNVSRMRPPKEVFDAARQFAREHFATIK